MTEIILIALIIILIICAAVALWKLPAGRSTASLQIEQCRINAERAVAERRLHRLKDTVMMLTSRQAMGCELTDDEREQLRIAHNELFHGGQP